MDNHPIPQDVTGFKFKLIGSMTVKQFLYLLGFGILATIAFVLHINFFIRIPLVILFASIGCALAFIPIEGRPMDVMIANFAKTIPSENRYIFKKRGVNLATLEIFKITPKIPHTQTVIPTAASVTQKQNDDKRAQLISRLRNSTFRPDAAEVKSLNNIHDLFEKGPKASVAPEAPTVPIAERPAEDHQEMEEKMKKLDAEIAAEAREKEIKKDLAATPTAEPAAPALTQSHIKFTGESAPHKLPTSAAEQKPIGQTPNPALSAGFPTLPDTGNVLLGIVRDPRQKSLPNVLVEVIDTNGIPVRTFKTNPLGQFSAATPLPNGSYRVHFEDTSGQHEFADAQINMSGDIFQPLDIKSTDAREKLRQELFGGAPVVAAA